MFAPRDLHTFEPMARHLLWILASLLVAGGCTVDEDTGDTIPATEGAIQPEGDGVSMSAEDGCRWLLGAVDRVRARRGGCSEIELACPEFILPAGTDVGCVTFDAGSVKACVAVLDDYATCADFQLKPCIVTALDLTCGGGGASGASAAAAGAQPKAGAGRGGS